MKQPPPSLRVQLPQETSIAALSVVNSHHHGSSASGNTSLQQQHLTIPNSGNSGAAILQHVPQMQATITPCSTTANDMPREGLVVVQVMLIYIFIIKILTACHLGARGGAADGGTALKAGRLWVRPYGVRGIFH